MKPLTPVLPRTGDITLKALTLTGLLVLAAGCSSIPKATTPESQFAQLDCTQLSAQRSEGEGIKRAASAAKAGSWKVIVPVFVAVRYVHANNAISNADERIVKVDEASLAKGCAASEPNMAASPETH